MPDVDILIGDRDDEHLWHYPEFSDLTVPMTKTIYALRFAGPGTIQWLPCEPGRAHQFSRELSEIWNNSRVKETTSYNFVF